MRLPLRSPDNSNLTVHPTPSYSNEVLGYESEA